MAISLRRFLVGAALSTTFLCQVSAQPTGAPPSIIQTSPVSTVVIPLPPAASSSSSSSTANPSDDASSSEHAAAVAAAAAPKKDPPVFPPPAGHPPLTTNSCSCWYMGVFEEFKIFGKNWNVTLLGEHGDGLLDNIKGCGIVTAWYWTPTGFPQDPNSDWVATGQVPLGKCPCVGQAVMAAGGVSIDGCW